MPVLENRETRGGPRAVPRASDLVRWGPVLAAVVIGLGLFALLNALWLAIAYSTGDGWVSGNLNWFVGASAAVALFAAGLLAGALAGVRGTMAGLANGISAWGLLLILSLSALIPGALNLTTTLGMGLREGADDVAGSAGTQGGGFQVESALWAGFWSLLIGLALAALGGVLGGKLHRPAATVPEQRPGAPTAIAETNPTTAETVVTDPVGRRRGQS